jgi:hypothetical protein
VAWSPILSETVFQSDIQNIVSTQHPPVLQSRFQVISFSNTFFLVFDACVIDSTQVYYVAYPQVVRCSMLLKMKKGEKLLKVRELVSVFFSESWRELRVGTSNHRMLVVQFQKL